MSRTSTGFSAVPAPRAACARRALIREAARLGWKSKTVVFIGTPWRRTGGKLWPAVAVPDRCRGQDAPIRVDDPARVVRRERDQSIPRGAGSAVCEACRPDGMVQERGATGPETRSNGFSLSDNYHIYMTKLAEEPENVGHGLCHLAKIIGE